MRMNEARELKRSVLEALSRRPDGHRHEALSVEGYTPSHVELAVKLLRLDGFVNAVFVPQPTRPSSPDYKACAPAARHSRPPN